MPAILTQVKVRISVGCLLLAIFRNHEAVASNWENKSLVINLDEEKNPVTATFFVL